MIVLIYNLLLSESEGFLWILFALVGVLSMLLLFAHCFVHRSGKSGVGGVESLL
jgi:hypothetical protein